jgi:hypothetical protein
MLNQRFVFSDDQKFFSIHKPDGKIERERSMAQYACRAGGSTTKEHKNLGGRNGDI